MEALAVGDSALIRGGSDNVTGSLTTSCDDVDTTIFSCFAEPLNPLNGIVAPAPGAVATAGEEAVVVVVETLPPP